MAERGSYLVNPKPKENYLAFICSLLVFLGLLVLIFCMTYFLKQSDAAAPAKLSSAKEEELKGNGIKKNNFSNIAFMPTTTIRYPADNKEGILDKNQTEQSAVGNHKDKQTNIVKYVNIALHEHENKSLPLDETKKKQINNSSSSVGDVNQYLPLDENEVIQTNVSSETNDIKNGDLFFNKTKDMQSNSSSGSDANVNIKIISSGADVNLNVISPEDKEKQTNLSSDTNKGEIIDGQIKTSSSSDADENNKTISSGVDENLNVILPVDKDKQKNTSHTNEVETMDGPTNISSGSDADENKKTIYSGVDVNLNVVIPVDKDKQTNTSDTNEVEYVDRPTNTSEINEVEHEDLLIYETGHTNTSSDTASVENEDSLLHENKDKITNTSSDTTGHENNDEKTSTSNSTTVVQIGDSDEDENKDKSANISSDDIGDRNKDAFLNVSVIEDGNKYKQNYITYKIVGDVNVILPVDDAKNGANSVRYKNQSLPADENNGEQLNNSSEAVRDTNINLTLDENNDNKTNVSSSENRDEDLLNNENEQEQTNTTSDIVGDINNTLTIAGNKDNEDNSSSESFGQESKFANNQTNSSFNTFEGRNNGLLENNSSNAGLPLDENNDTDIDSRRSLSVNETLIVSSDLLVNKNNTQTVLSDTTTAQDKNLTVVQINIIHPKSVFNATFDDNNITDILENLSSTLPPVGNNTSQTTFSSGTTESLSRKRDDDTQTDLAQVPVLNSTTTTNSLDTAKDANETLSTTNSNDNTTAITPGYVPSIANRLNTLQTNYNKYWYVSSIEIGNNETEETPSTAGIPEYLNTTTTTIMTKNINLQTSLQQIIKGCASFTCKNLASSMLAKMNHSISPCEDFYQFACGGNHFREDNFRENIFDNIIADNYKGAPEIFITFITSCKMYDSDFNFVERKKSVIEPDVNSFEIEDLIVEMVRLQTMHFFDISVTFGEGSELTFLVTPTKHEILKTTLTGWSMVDHFRDRCFEKHTRQLTIDATSKQTQKSNNDTNICFILEIRRYLEGYANENNIDESEVEKLIHLLNTHLKLSFTTSSEPLTLTEFVDEYEQLWDVNWKRIFDRLHNSKSLDPDSQIIVQNGEDLKAVFAQFGKISNASKLLALWHNVQLYHNIAMNRQENNDYYCLNLAFELMPDIATNLVYSRYMTSEKARNDVSYIYEVLDKMKHNKNIVFSGVQMDMNKFKIRTLTDSFDYDVDQTNYINLNLNESDFSTNFKNLLRNYRSQLYHFINETIDAKIILKYFIDVFESKPKVIEPLKEIVYHPRFLELASTDAPKFIPNARIGYSLAEEILKGYGYDADDIFKNDNILDYGLEPMQEGYINIIAENAAYKLFTDFYEKTKTTYTETIVFASPTYSIQQMFLIFSAQDHCKKGIQEEKMFDVTAPIPARMKIRNTAKNSQFFYKTFNCPENGVYWPNIEPRMPLTSN